MDVDAIEQVLQRIVAPDATDREKTEARALWDRIQNDVVFWSSHFSTLVDESAELVRFNPRPAQLMLEAAAAKQHAAGKPMRLWVLKARRTGSSTWNVNRLVHTLTTKPNRRGMVVAQDNTTASELFGYAELIYDNLPDRPWIKPPTVNRRSSTGGEKYIHWGEPSRTARAQGNRGIDSRLVIDTAKEVAAGRGMRLTDLLMCLVPDTPVIVDDGRIIPVSEVEVGMQVITHTGAAATVSAVASGPPGEENGGGRTVKITPWLGRTIEMTPNHKVWTKRGWVEAGDLTKEDWVSMPVRPITHGRTTVRLPDAPVRRQGGGRRSVAAGATVELTEEFGFACGYYLAEGSLGHNKGRPAQVTFSRHRNEVAYADRATKGLVGLYTTRHTADRVASLTTHDVVYGSPLARFLFAEFGSKEAKRVPDWVFDAGEEFARGLLAGYLSGDGSKVTMKHSGYEFAHMTATSICSSIATQIRDIALSLGYGWGNIANKPAGQHYGRNCREAWVTSWSGPTAAALRDLIGLPSPQTTRPSSNRVRIEGGTAWLPIRKIEQGQTDLVYDIEVDHSDHSFRTLYFAVSNSEVAFWPDPDKALSLIRTVPDRHGTFIVGESTAQGHGFFKTRWDNAEKGLGGFAPVFISWLIDPNTIKPFDDPDERQRFLDDEMDKGPYGEDEPALRDRMAKLGIGETEQIERLNYRRHSIIDIADGDLTRWTQEEPSTPLEAFRGSGRHVFSISLIEKAREEAALHDPPLGDPTLPEGAPQPGDGLLDVPHDKWATRTLTFGGTTLVPEEVLWLPIGDPRADKDTDRWRIWEHPEKGGEGVKPGQYVAFVDVAAGEEMTSTGDTDYHAIQVIDHLTGEQCAEYRSRSDRDQLALEAYKAAAYFNNALLAVEVTGGYGLGVAEDLWKKYGYRRMYRQRPVGVTREKAQRKLGWDTTRKTKPKMEDIAAELLREESHGIKSLALVGEMATYVRFDSGRHGADTDQHDDLLVAWMGAQRVRQLEHRYFVRGSGTGSALPRAVGSRAANRGGRYGP